MFTKTLLFLVLLLALFHPAERLFPARRTQRPWRRGSFHDLLHGVLNPLLINFGAALLLAILAVALSSLVPTSIRDRIAAKPVLLQFFEIVLLAEICGYWAHRLAHRIPWLWKFHAVHHSIEELDWLSSHRQHPIEATWMLGAQNVPVLLLGFSVPSLVSFVLFQKIYTVFVHSNVRVSFGPLRHLLASPAFHHWHHAKEKSCHDRNFSSLFPFLDLLFGTYLEPNGKFPEKLGTEETVPRTWWGQLGYPFRRKAG